MRMAAIRALIARALYPENACCIVCGRLRVDDRAWALCEDCAAGLALLEGPFCPRCGAVGWAVECPDCAVRQPGAMDACLAAYPYEGVAGGLVRALKYSAVHAAAAALADGMAAVLADKGYDVLLPVPLHRGRQRQRGFNQADVLCRALSARTGMPIADALQRTRATRTQTELSLAGRAQNVRGAFEVTSPVKGMSILLVDDVLTTGATAGACAAALKDAGARRVALLAATRALV